MSNDSDRNDLAATLSAQRGDEAGQRLRTTIVIEASSQEDLEEGLATGAALAKARVMFMSLGSHRLSGPHVSCRTTRMRIKKQ